jgi:Niemann-Pick C1 protein
MHVPQPGEGVQDFFDFIGTVKDKNPFHIGSPFQLDFPSGSEDVPEPIVPWQQHVPTCWDSVLKCSCGDCPAAPLCSRSAPVVPQPAAGCTVGSIGSLTVYCSNLAVLAAVAVALPALCWAFATGKLATDKQPSGTTTPNCLCAST